jgi:phage-related protein
MNWEIIYYNEAVRLWVDSLPVGIRAYYARITGAMSQYGPNLGMPYTRALGEELFEIRARGKEGIARIFSCTVVRGKIMVLHGFVKKTDKTPRRELATARRRLTEVQDENA